MSKHTPGPWKVGGRYGNIGVEVFAEDRCLAVVNRVQENRRAMCAKRKTTVGGASYQPEIDKLNKGLPQAIADARLIAAAPDLLEAAEAVLETYKTDCLTTLYGAECEEGCPECALRAAIAKAKEAPDAPTT